MAAVKQPAARSPRPSTVHRRAVERMLRATGLANVPEEAPLVALVKSLAKDMDLGGGTRVRAEYLSALKDVRRVLSTGSGRRVKGTSEPAATKSVEDAAGAVPSEQPRPNELAEFKKRHGIAS